MFQVTVDTGTGAQPQKKGTLQLDRATGETKKWEPFEAQSKGRQWRSWMRFAHTGEYYGLVGQTIAVPRHRRFGGAGLHRPGPHLAPLPRLARAQARRRTSDQGRIGQATNAKCRNAGLRDCRNPDLDIPAFGIPHQASGVGSVQRSTFGVRLRQ